MKYKLINKQTGEEHLCDKVTIDGFDYYVSDDKLTSKCYVFDPIGYRIAIIHIISKKGENFGAKKVIATNNPSIDLPKVVDEVLINKEKNQELIDLINHTLPTEQLTLNQESLIYHHSKSQETYPFSEEDMKKAYYEGHKSGLGSEAKTFKNLIKDLKEQQPKIVYYGE